MRQRKDFAERLRPLRHAAKGKHEAGQQERRQKEEERHLHRLQLILRHRRDREAQREQRRNIKHHRDEQERHAAEHRYVEQQSRRAENDRRLDEANHDVGNDLPRHHLERKRHVQQVLAPRGVRLVVAVVLLRHLDGHVRATGQPQQLLVGDALVGGRWRGKSGRGIPGPPLLPPRQTPPAAATRLFTPGIPLPVSRFHGSGADPYK